MTDPDVLSKQYSYSKENPLYIVMETPDAQTADKLSAERKIRRTLQNTLRQREDEIERLKEENKISQQEYQQKLQELYSSQEKNEKLISEMAERYSKMDYDQMDEFNRRISEYIMNGELAKADSLLSTKGDINARVAALKHHQDINAKEEEELTRRKENLSKSQSYTQKELEDLAQDCYHKYEIFKVDFQNDSAAYYLEIRAGLDTMNVDWQLEAGVYIGFYLAAYDRTLSYYQRALSNALLRQGDNHPNVARCYKNIGMVYSSQGKYVKALEYLTKALEIYLAIYGDSHSDVADSYNSIGLTYTLQGKYAKALDCFTKAQKIFLSIYGDSHSTVAMCRANIGYVYFYLRKYVKALDYFTKALEIFQSTYGDSHYTVAECYGNIGCVYKLQGKYSKALVYCTKALDIHLAIFGDSHPNIASDYINIGVVYSSQGDYGRALEYFNKALEIYRAVFGTSHPNVLAVLKNIEYLNNEMQK